MKLKLVNRKLKEINEAVESSYLIEFLQDALPILEAVFVSNI